MLFHLFLRWVSVQSLLCGDYVYQLPGWFLEVWCLSCWLPWWWCPLPRYWWGKKMTVYSLKGSERKWEGRIKSQCLIMLTVVLYLKLLYSSAKRFLMPALSSTECTGVRILNPGTTVYLVHHVSLAHSHLVVVLKMPWLTNRYCQLENCSGLWNLTKLLNRKHLCISGKEDLVHLKTPSSLIQNQRNIKQFLLEFKTSFKNHCSEPSMAEEMLYIILGE